MGSNNFGPSIVKEDGTIKYTPTSHQEQRASPVRGGLLDSHPDQQDARQHAGRLRARPAAHGARRAHPLRQGDRRQGAP